MSTKCIFIDSDNMKLEARITVPNLPTSSNSIPAIIIAHPYGPLGGNINNNVVVSLHKGFSEKGFLTVSFNFRYNILLLLVIVVIIYLYLLYYYCIKIEDLENHQVKQAGLVCLNKMIIKQ